MLANLKIAVIEALVPATGRIITLAGSTSAAAAVQDTICPIDYVGFVQNGEIPGAGEDHDSNWAIEEITSSTPYPAARIYRDGEPVGVLRLSVPGKHNLLNGTMAVAACVACGYAAGAAAEAVSRFTGVDRRMSNMGQVNGASVVDDYGHHPTEIVATLSALRETYKPRRLLCVFQPHQASRTRLLMNDFAGAFTDADQVYLPDIYYVRDSDEDRREITSPVLAAKINQSAAGKAIYCASFDEAVERVRAEASPGDLVVTMGAGNIVEVARKLTDG